MDSDSDETTAGDNRTVLKKHSLPDRSGRGRPCFFAAFFQVTDFIKEERVPCKPLCFQLLVQIILILINAFFAATEIAVISLNANKLRKLEEEGDKLAPKLLHMVEDSSGFLSTIQIAITLSGFLAPPSPGTPSPST